MAEVRLFTHSAGRMAGILLDSMLPARKNGQDDPRGGGDLPMT